MKTFEGYQNYFGDLHNHCGISYGRGSLEEALSNARQRLDFCAITGHAHWPDMPDSVSERSKPIIEFHKKGFEKLKGCWDEVRRTLKDFTAENKFIAFLSFEIHSLADGDYTVVYKEADGEILYVKDIGELSRELQALRSRGTEVIAFPHHIAYPRGARGINWDTYTDQLSPVVEIVSMHGCSENNEHVLPYLIPMGPSDWEGTVTCGLSRGKRFGFIGNTDHHSAHPGSYGHGATGLWASEYSRNGIWNALHDRRTYALTGDKISLEFSVNGCPMGSTLDWVQKRNIQLSVAGGDAIEYVDIIKNGTSQYRFFQNQVGIEETGETIKTKLFLEVGWGHRSDLECWNVYFGVDDGCLVSVEPRFRGREILSPLNRVDEMIDRYCISKWHRVDMKTVYFETYTTGNPNHTTNTAQGMCIEVEVPVKGNVVAVINGHKMVVSLERLLAGSKAGYLYNDLESPAWIIHKAPLPGEMNWDLEVEDKADDTRSSDYYYARVLQKNRQWAWSSPVYFVR